MIDWVIHLAQTFHSASQSGLSEFSGSPLTSLLSHLTILAKEKIMNRVIDRIILEYIVAVLTALVLEDENELQHLHSLLPLMRILAFLRD